MTRASKAKPEKPASPRKTKPAPYAVPHGHVFGTATAGYRGTATAGEGGSISIRWWDGDASRWRLRSGDVGAKETLKPGVKYRLNDRGEFEEAK